MGKLPDIDQILVEMIQVGGEILHFEIHELNNSIWNKEEFHEQWNESFINQFRRRMIKLIAV
jgi:hypothetical protein